MRKGAGRNARLQLPAPCGGGVRGGGVRGPRGLCGRRACRRTDFFMSTLVTQQAYGPRAEDALAQAADTLREWEARLSLYEEDSDICRINAPRRTARAGERSHRRPAGAGEGAGPRRRTAPLPLRWRPSRWPGACTAARPVWCRQKSARHWPRWWTTAPCSLRRTRPSFPKRARGWTSAAVPRARRWDAVAGVYEKAGVQSAVVSLGGNVYARGTKPGGRPWARGLPRPIEGR